MTDSKPISRSQPDKNSESVLEKSLEKSFQVSGEPSSIKPDTYQKAADTAAFFSREAIKNWLARLKTKAEGEESLFRVFKEESEDKEGNKEGAKADAPVCEEESGASQRVD